MININCDLGEGLNNEHILMPLINSCNIACGGHAGDSQSIIECVEISTPIHPIITPKVKEPASPRKI